MSPQIEPSNTIFPDGPNAESNAPPARNSETAAARGRRRVEGRRWWLKLFIQPALLLACAAAGITALGVAQRIGWISTGGTHGDHSSGSVGELIDYICPMMCTPPQKGPGRCPVCAMELVPAATGNTGGDKRSIIVDAATRRVANIQTVSVKSAPSTHVIRTVGKLTYDEGTLKTIAAWVPGRLERLYADYTGVVVNKSDQLALVYSPDLYSGQMELLIAKKAQAAKAEKSTGRQAFSESSLYESARQRLIEQGMTEDQIQQLELDGKANSRLHLCAPISGTVIEKLATEGEYVKEGQAIYKLADLSNVWLMLELFPEDAASIRYGQKVTAEVQSLPGRIFEGRVAFINPHVDEQTRTVGVRVVIPNSNGILRVGDFATASISVPVMATRLAAQESLPQIYDPELANKWISPRHPHIVASGPGKCPVCAVDLIPASQFGFAEAPQTVEEVLTVPRNAVLMAGKHSVVYVETEPGRFEIRTVVLGPGIEDELVVLQGLTAGEQVATSGNFLIDSQMQLVGNPSLIDPTRALPRPAAEFSSEAIAALSHLSDGDRQLAEQQRICPVAEVPLGSMGIPLKVNANGRFIFLCCEGCRARLLGAPDKYIAILEAAKNGSGAAAKADAPELPPIEAITPADAGAEVPSGLLPPKGDLEDEEREILKSLSQLSSSDMELARRQIICPVAEQKLGTMGPPVKVEVAGRSVFICCESCRKKLMEEPDKYLARLPKERAQ